MGYNVCRPITLHNDFLPPAEAPHEDRQYLLFGYNDGLIIGENLFSDGMCSMEEIWNYDIKQVEALRGTYTEQTIYGFRAQDDTKFWEEAKREETEYPFIFVVLLQGRMEETKTELYNRCRVEQELSDEGKRRVITYLTLDNSGMVMVLLCRYYEDGSELVDRFHRGREEDYLKEMGLEMTYSFTFAGVQKKFLGSERIYSLADRMLSCAYIYAIERYPGSIHKVQDNIKAVLKSGAITKKESVLGCNDEVMVMENVPWSEFLKLFRDETGVLNHSCPQYRQQLIGITTIICQKQEETDDSRLSADKAVMETDGADKKDVAPINGCTPPRKIRLSEAMRKRIQERDDSDFQPEASYLNRYLFQVINALQKFEDAPLADYVFCSMFLPIDMLLNIAENVGEHTRQDFIRNFHKFVKGLHLCVQNAIRSDRQFTQSLDFDIRIYNTPVRLNAFYNAFIYFMKNFLDKLGPNTPSGHRYEFLASLGVTDTIQVEELFRNMYKGNRLFLVSIPENQAYDMQLMLLTLSHEVGHFVGQAIRNREYREKCAIKITAKATALCFQRKLEAVSEGEEQILNGVNEEYWKRFEDRFNEYLTQETEKLKQPEYLKEKFRGRSEEELRQLKELYTDYQYYTHVMSDILKDSVSDILIHNKEELFGYLQETVYLNSIKLQNKNNAKGTKSAENAAREARDNIMDKIAKISKEITGYSVWGNGELSINTVVDEMILLFKECEADLMGILTLELSYEDYLRAIQRSLVEQGIPKGDFPAKLNIRSGLVAYTLSYQEEGEDFGYGWRDDAPKDIDKSLSQINICIINFRNDYLSDAGTEKQSCMEKLDVFLNKEILYMLLGYLLGCRRSFYCHMKQEDTAKAVELQDMQERLQKMFRLCLEPNVEKLIWNMQGHIEEYQRLLWDEIRITAERRTEECQG